MALAATAAAQAAPEENLFAIDLSVDDETFKEVEYLQQVEFQCSLTDLSRDATLESPGTFGLVHQTRIDVEVFPYFAPGSNVSTNLTRPPGWATGGSTTLNTFGGQTVPFTVQVKTSGPVRDNYVTVRIRATAQGVAGEPVTDETFLVVKLAPYHAGRVLMREAPPHLGQDAVTTYPVEVTSFNSYPDAFLLEAHAPEGFFASVPPRVVLGPYETRVVNVTIQSPHTRLWDFGTTGSISVTMRNENEPQVVYTTGTAIMVAGPYLPVYWIPIVALGLVGGAVVAGDRRRAAVLARGEKGLPRRPRPTPREAALLAELKRRDPEAYKKRVAQYEALYAQRREVWKVRRKEELAQERRERLESRRAERERAEREARLTGAKRALDRARAEDAKRVEKLRRAEEKRLRKEAKLAAKRERKVAARDAKQAAKRAKAEAKERRKLEKALAKKRAELEKVARRKRRELAKAKDAKDRE